MFKFNKKYEEIMENLTEAIDRTYVNDAVQKRGEDFVKHLEKKGVKVTRSKGGGAKWANDSVSYTYSYTYDINLKPRGTISMDFKEDKNGKKNYSIAFFPQGTVERETFEKLPTIADLSTALKNLEKSSEHVSWLRDIGYLERADDFDLAELKKLASKHIPWFSIDYKDDIEIGWITRKHGSVGSDTAGKKDINAANSFKEAVRKAFPKYSVNTESIDEWTTVKVKR